MLMSEKEFISFDSEVPCTAVLEDDDILDMVRDNDEIDSDVEITEIMARTSEASPPPSFVQVRCSLNTILRFVECHQYASETDIRSNNLLRSRLEFLISRSQTQKSITDYFPS